ncbi:putative metal-dependent membrane protease [Streptococcus pneumoniae]|nr:putative metal-dependent membrane protease [Streptococcus pneumoniae]
MKKMKEVKFHLATGLLILTYYLIFNVTSDLEGKSNNLYLSSYPEWKYSRRSSHQFNRN